MTAVVTEALGGARIFRTTASPIEDRRQFSSVRHILAALINNHSHGLVTLGGGMTITISEIENTTEDYRGFKISWGRPAFANAKWTANVTSEATHLAALLGRGLEIIEGRDREQVIANSRRYIDSLFG
jgi:hypothetical protein